MGCPIPSMFKYCHRVTLTHSHKMSGGAGANAMDGGKIEKMRAIETK
jgi:hypothetical protein